MKATIELENPNDLRATISMTLTLEDWVKLRTQMDGMPYYGGAQELRQAITVLTNKACANFQYEPEEQAAE